MRRIRPLRLGAMSALAPLLAPALLACGDGPAAPPAELAFSATALELGGEREATLTLTNAGTRAVGPVALEAGAVLGAGGNAVPGAVALPWPAEVATLNAGAGVPVTVEVRLPEGTQPGRYEVRLTARAEDDASAAVDVGLEVVSPTALGVTSLTIAAPPSSLRQGDVARLSAVARDADGGALPSAPVTWSVDPADGGFFGPGGRFVAYGPGAVRVVAASGSAVDTAEVAVTARGMAGSFEPVGEGLELDRFSSDLWVHGDHAYQGTWGRRDRDGVPRFGNALFTWDVSRPSAPVRTDTLTVDARVVNDVKVRADGRLALITHEGSNDGRNGVTVLDLADPARPRVVSRFTEGLEPGVHNAWIDGRWAYLVVDGVGSGLRVLDLQDPSSPRVVASWWAGSSFLHDVYVRDGLAFLSHWNAGLVILDVGNGVAGGSPQNPVEVSRLATLGGETHNAWYWPAGGLVFVGEEDFAAPGRVHVVDLENPFRPREVATFAVPGQTPHNFWVDEAAGILHVGWYGRGIRSIDVTGALLGDLGRQGREIAGLEYNGPSDGCPAGSSTCTWAPQLHEGLLWLSDMNAGLVVLRPLGDAR